MAPGWEKDLYTYVCDAFSTEDLRVFARYEAELPAGTLGEGSASITQVAADFVSGLRRHGLIGDGLFDALKAARVGRAAEIEAIRAAWKTDRRSDPASDAPHAAVVLDRILQWDRVLKECETSDRHLILLVHGDHEQDVDLFMLRIKRYLTVEVEGRRHGFYEVLRTEEHEAVSGGDWARRLTLATKMGRDLADALSLSAVHRAVVYLFEDYGHPLKGLRWKPDFEGLVELFAKHVAKALAEEPPKHPLRFVLPFQHAEDGKTVRECVKKAAAALEKLGSYRVVVLDELEFPPLDDVLTQIKMHHETIYDDVRPAIEALHAEFTDRTLTPEPTIRAFGARLQELLDDARARRREARRDASPAL